MPKPNWKTAQSTTMLMLTKKTGAQCPICRHLHTAMCQPPHQTLPISRRPRCSLARGAHCAAVHFWLRGVLEGLQHSRLAIGLAAEGYGVHQTGQDDRPPRLCNKTRSLRRRCSPEKGRGDTSHGQSRMFSWPCWSRATRERCNVGNDVWENVIDSLASGQLHELGQSCSHGVRSRRALV